MASDHPTGSRLPDVLPENPLPLARQWFDHALEHASQRNPDSMTLVTLSGDGQPAARVVLCKDFVVDPGYLVFYTNYESDKGRALALNPRVATVMHWDALGRQVRCEGLALRSPAAESDAYFASRGRGSQLGAWGSDQSRPLGSRGELIAQVRRRASELGVELAPDTTTVESNEAPPLPRPPHWGGYRIWIGALELWAEGADRIHDRARWARSLKLDPAGGCVAGEWSRARLQP